jgi:catechol 2,3-dioxygenase-like lactoylglutathione lyase family enzyme
MPMIGVHHFSISVTDLDQTLEFYTRHLGAEVENVVQNKHATLGRSLFGTKWGIDQQLADITIALVRIGEVGVEFIQYHDPPAPAYHMNPAAAGSAHIAVQVEEIEAVRAQLEGEGVEFHSPINYFHGEKWCYFRDPDGIVVELIQPPVEKV